MQMTKNVSSSLSSDQYAHLCAVVIYRLYYILILYLLVHKCPDDGQCVQN